jgi:fumarate reductase flavoprotein subunit
LIVSKGRISEIEITGEDETPGVGQAAFKPLREAILEAQSVDVEGISGATRTSKGVLDAAEHALNKARGFEAEEITSSVLADGTYTAQTWSFSPNYPMEVSVGVKDNRFTSIEVIGGNDTEPILKSAEKLLIPRMIESQSVTMDAIAGATVSSNAIKTAVEACLVQSIEAAGGDKNSIQAFYTTGEKNNASARIQTDVLVVGMGGSGIVTAVRTAEKLYAAHDNNADAVRVLGIEKAGKYGGTSAVTSSPMSINPPSYVEKNGGEPFVDIDTLRSAWIEYTEGDAKDWAIDYMMFESGHASDWLAERGFEFGAPMQGLAYPYKAVVAYGGGFGTSKSEIGGYFDAIMEYYTSIGGEYMLETAAVDLLSDEKGNVIGVIAESYDGTQYEIYAEAVVLATGGFAGSADMTEKYLSTEFYPLTGDAYNVYGMMQNDGTMIEAAIQKGAATYNIGTPPISHIGGAAGIMHEFETTPIEGTFDIWTGREMTRSLNDVPMMMAVAPNALAVNASGKRFADETFLGSYGNWMAGPRYYTIWSAEMIDEIKNKGFRFNTNGLFINQGGWPADTPIENIEEVLEAAIRHGLVVSADSLSALAPKLDMDSSTLETTVRQYNEYCDTQTDPADGVVKNSVVLDFSGRPVESEHSTFQKVEGKGPYYAVVCSPWIYSTAGGLDINEQFQVLDKRGNAVKGLYAVGTDSIGVLLTEKKEYVGYGGAAQGWAFTSGYLTGEIIANDILKK